MTILDEVIRLKQAGRSDAEIISNLQEKGSTPAAINDALNQYRIKNAVSNETQNDQEYQPGEYIPQEQYNSQNQYAPQEQYTPQPQTNIQGQYNSQDYASQAPAPQTYQPSQYSPDPQDQYYQGGQTQYAQEGYDSYAQGGSDVNTIMEISEQVFLEKIKNIQKKISKLDESRKLNQVKIESTEERLKRIESTIDKLQSAVLGKIGEYGNNLQGIKKELEMMQESFGKAIKDYSTKGSYHK